jgi:hypothetical protein
MVGLQIPVLEATSNATPTSTLVAANAHDGTQYNETKNQSVPSLCCSLNPSFCFQAMHLVWTTMTLSQSLLPSTIQQQGGRGHRAGRHLEGGVWSAL